MKPSRNILVKYGLAAVIVIIGAPVLSAQTADLSTGTVLDSSVAPPPKPLPEPLQAKLTPDGEDHKTKGSLTFSIADGKVSVSGQLEGLEPDKRYQIAILPRGQKTEKDNTSSGSGTATVRPTAASTGNPRATPQSAAGTPNAGPPVESTPAAGKPAAGKPNGEERLGPGGAGSSGSSVTGNSGVRPAATSSAATESEERSEVTHELVVVTADKEGNANVITVINDLKLTKGPDGIQGRTIIIRASLDGSPSPERMQVASGTIGIPKPAVSP